jgi:Ca2+-binding RTX toxin-like protein
MTYTRLRNVRRAALLGAAIALGAASAADAATVSVAGDTAVFRAAPGEANDVRLGEYAPGSLYTLGVTDTGAPLKAGRGCQQVDAHSAVCGDPRYVVVEAGNGDDRVREESSSRVVTLRGGTGNDTVHSGSRIGKSPVLVGGPGEDTLSVNNNGDGLPLIYGGTGDDSLTIGENGGGRLYGEQGDDRLYLYSSFYREARLEGGKGDDTYGFRYWRASTLGLIVPGRGLDTLDQSSWGFSYLGLELAACPGCVERAIGTPGDDVMTGDEGDQAILGGDGQDILDGAGGSDFISGQGGDDTITSRDGTADEVQCGEGNDTVLADQRDVVSADCEAVTRE